jgi:hypothetical protein
MSEVEAAPAATENAAASTPEVTQVQVVEPSQPSIEDTMGSVFDKHFPDARVDRARDTGKFQPKGAEPAEPAKEINQEPVEDKPETVAVEAPKPSTKARPQSWSADLDQWWSELPPERQDFLLKRETEAHQKITQLGETAKVADQFKSVIDRYRHVLNGPADREIETLLATKDALLRNPEASILRLAEQLGVDLSRYAQSPTGEQSPENAEIRSLRQENAQLKREFGEIKHHITVREQKENLSREQSLENLVNEFAKDKDYWGDVEAGVLEQIHAIKAVHPNKDPKEVLAEAHDRAIKLNDEVSNRLNKAKRDKEAAEKAAADKRKADEAKRLASLNTKSSSGASPKAAFKSFEDEMSAVYDKVSARG